VRDVEMLDWIVALVVVVCTVMFICGTRRNL